MPYAKETDVPFERSVAEIVGLLKKAGADQIAQVDQRERFTIQFTMADRMLRFRVDYLSAEQIDKLTGPRQDPAKVKAQWHRQRGRALLLVIKAKLEAVDSGVETFEQAFLANVVLSNGETVHERIASPIAAEYETGTVQPTGALFLQGPR